MTAMACTTGSTGGDRKDALFSSSSLGRDSFAAGVLGLEGVFTNAVGVLVPVDIFWGVCLLVIERVVRLPSLMLVGIFVLLKSTG